MVRARADVRAIAHAVLCPILLPMVRLTLQPQSRFSRSLPNPQTILRTRQGTEPGHRAVVLECMYKKSVLSTIRNKWRFAGYVLVRRYFSFPLSAHTFAVDTFNGHIRYFYSLYETYPAMTYLPTL